MCVKKSIKKFIGGGLVAFMCLIMAPAAMAAPVTGAIFTTLFDGSAVDFNIYDTKEDVYLNGGPRSPKAPCTAAGLPDGYYAFQVTDPSGQVVLSTDDLSQRIVQVLGGVIVASFSHPTGTGKCNSETVQLMPFNDTPNPGGEYKVWMAPINPSGPLVVLFSFPVKVRPTTLKWFPVFPTRQITSAVVVPLHLHHSKSRST